MSRRLPLAGVTVVDTSSLLPGPYCTLLLADLGADVIRVERPEHAGDVANLAPGLHEMVNRNKRSIRLNLKVDAERDVFLRLAQTADVVVDGFRPGVLDRLGVGYERLRADNPRLIFCALTGYGQTGPYRDRPGHDLNYQGVAGALAYGGQPPQTPDSGYVQGVPVADLAGATFAALGILAALLERNQSGQGQYVDVAMTDVVLSLISYRLGGFFANGSAELETRGAEASYGVFETADGTWLTLGVIEDAFWRKLCDALGWPDLRDDPDLATPLERNRRRDQIVPRLKATLRSRPRAAWLALFAEHGVPAAPSNSWDELVADEQLRARGMFENIPGQSVPAIVFPLKMSGTQPAPPTAAPQPGADTLAVLASLNHQHEGVAQR